MEIMENTALIKYDAARLALREARTYDEVKNIRDASIALAAYGRQAKDTQLIEDATDIKLRAERRAAQMIDEARYAGDLAEHGGDRKTNQASNLASLKDAGISYTDASRWRKLGSMSDAAFEDHLEQKKKAVGAAVNKVLNASNKKLTPNRPDLLGELRAWIKQACPAIAKQVCIQSSAYGIVERSTNKETVPVFDLELRSISFEQIKVVCEEMQRATAV